jgi:NADPH:quinone reductase-like Zn-dependent oxidoreductase
MKAIVRDTYGSPDVVELREVDKPVAGADDVLLRCTGPASIKASGT